MRPFVIAAVLLAATVSTASADIQWKTGAIAPGSTVTLKNSDGRVFTHMRMQDEDGMTRFDTFAGRDTGAPFAGSFLTNRRGEITRMVSASGEVTSFSPHRCMRTLGECHYTITYADGFRENRIRVTEATANGLKYREFGTQGLMTSGVLALDSVGTSAGGWSKDHQTGRKTRVTRVSAVYR